MTTTSRSQSSSSLTFSTAAEKVESHLTNVVAESVALPAPLHEAMNYSLLAGGKRLRPALVLLCCDALGGEVPSALGPAAALEMIHCFSLIHDDLPAMDDDDLRRGQPANHKKFGEELAILAGDSLATLPYLLLARSDKLTVTQRSLLTAELATATMAMIAGQVHDTIGGFAENLSDAQRLELTHRNKTGALIRAACRIGGIVAGADEDALQSLAAYGEALGLMFQIVDDVLDITQTSDHLGKTSGKDHAAGKLTYPAVYGLEEARNKIDALQIDALAVLDLCPIARDRSRQPLQDLVAKLAARTK